MADGQERPGGGWHSLHDPRGHCRLPCCRSSHSHYRTAPQRCHLLAEVKEPARHTDVRQTMKYAHIGIEDQAKALSSLPLPKIPKEIAGKNWQRSGSGTGVSPCQTTSSSVNGGDSEDEEGELKNPCNSRGSVTKCQPKSSFGMTFDEWRRRESNEKSSRRKALQDKSLRHQRILCLHIVCTQRAANVSCWHRLTIGSRELLRFGLHSPNQCDTLSSLCAMLL